jgi:hypothetical protein
MIIRLRHDRPPVILEPTDLKRLDAQVPEGDLATADLGSLGRLDPDGDHVWLVSERLKTAADPGDADPGWGERFDSMLTYAQSKGWVVGNEVRVHLVRSSPDAQEV